MIPRPNITENLLRPEIETGQSSTVQSLYNTPPSYMDLDLSYDVTVIQWIMSGHE